MEYIRARRPFCPEKTPEPTAMSESIQAPAASPQPLHPVTDHVHEAMAITRRGCEELLPEADWLRKLARAEATGQPLRVKLGWIRPRPTSISATPWCSIRCANCRIWAIR